MLRKLKDDVIEGRNTGFSLLLDGILKFKERLCVPEDLEIREQIMSKAHLTPYSIHPGTIKMYKD